MSGRIRSSNEASVGKGKPIIISNKVIIDNQKVRNSVRSKRFNINDNSNIANNSVGHGTKTASRAVERVVVVENPNVGWTSTFNHQKRPDHDLRMKTAMPYHKMVRPSRKAFTTDVPGPG